MGLTTLRFSQQLQTSIAGGGAGSRVLTLIFSSFSHLDLFRAANGGPFGFRWKTDVLNSGYLEWVHYQVAGRMVELLGKEVGTHPPKYFFTGWVLPLLLLGFLPSGEKLHTRESSPYPGFTALRTLLCRPVDGGHFGTTILLVLASTLLPTHPHNHAASD